MHGTPNGGEVSKRGPEPMALQERGRLGLLSGRVLRT